MRTISKSPFTKFVAQIVLMVAFGVMAACNSSAQVLTTLHSFDNADGANPVADLLLLSNALYGTTYYGGTSSNGTVFKVNVDGTGFQSLYSFTTSNGINPAAGLILSNTTLFGTASHGGVSNCGVVFKINPNGSGYSVLHFFSGSDGKEPLSRLSVTNGVLYGTTYLGGTNNKGTVFKVNADGSSFATLHNFNGSDGEYPAAGVVLRPGSSALYGTTAGDFLTVGGTVFSINTSGASFTTLHTFETTNGSDAEVLCADGALFGTTVSGGTNGEGTVFGLYDDGSGFGTILNLSELTGMQPVSDLIIDGNTLYGTAAYGGSLSNGTVFAVDTDGTGFSWLWNFQGKTDGKTPSAGLVQSNQTLYGTTMSAGQAGGGGYGTVFAIEVSCGLWDWWKGDSNTVDSVGAYNGTAVGTVKYVPAYSCFGFALTNSYIDFGAEAGNFGTNDFE
ncbi:MAG TPA: choice-of-anchor tandem repeat GloVer-containing protein, partial [Verrucomicrobiae bacterium]|nr:choice-of-anchor tandem repeat GloVer-containing protein [Verrucomicrobiae bacterium]